MLRKYEQCIKATTQIHIYLEKGSREGVRLPPFTFPLFTETVRKDRKL